MAVPDLKHVVQAVRNAGPNGQGGPWPFRSKEQLCAYTQACIRALYAADSNFGNLKKVPAQNHCTDSQGRLHATDVALYKPTGQIIDFIASAGFEPDPSKPEPGNGVTWGVGPEGEYPETSWFAPSNGGSTPGPGPVDPPPGPTPDPLEPRVVVLEAELTNLKAEVAANKTRMEAINTRFDGESNDNVKKPLPDYVGTVRIFGFSFNVVSKPR